MIRARAPLAALLALAACHHGPDVGAKPGLLVSGGPLVVAEGGGAATFEVALATAPAADVDVDVLAEDASEGLVTGPAGGAPGAWVRLRFGPSDWSSPQPVTVGGVDDLARDGDVAWRVRVLVAASADDAYGRVPGASIDVVTRDDDTPGIRVSRTTLSTAETGDVADAFEVSLASQPSEVVTISVWSTDLSEGLVAGGPHGIARASAIDLVYTPSSWSTPQPVTVWSQDDFQVDGTQVYSVVVGAATGDPEYAALPNQEVTVVNADTDVADVVVSAPDGSSVGEGGYVRLAVTLATAPAEPVRLRVASGDLAQAYVTTAGGAVDADGSVTLDLGPGSWWAPQEVWVRAVVDYAIDGDRTVPIALGPPTGDPAYAALPVRTVEVTVVDLDRPADVLLAQESLTVREGYAAALGFRLSTRPTEPVWVRVASSDASKLTLEPSLADASDAGAVSYRFDATSWDVERWVQVRAAADGIVDGTQTVPLVFGPYTGDPRFAALPAKTLEVHVLDAERPGILDAAGGFLALTEGGSATVPVSLAAAPTADVVVPIRSSDASEVLVSAPGAGPAATLELTFTPESWNQPQPVTVWAVNDALLEPDPPHPFTVSVGPTRSASAPYDGIAGSPIAGAVTDDEVYASEGSLDAPLDVSGALQWTGQVGPASTSTYRLTGFPEGGIVRLRGASAPVALYVLEDAPLHDTICAPRTRSVDGWCVVRLPPGGSMLVSVDGGGTRRGATFTVDAAPFTMATDVPLAIPDAAYPGAVSRIALSGVPLDFEVLALFVEIVHPRVADLQLWVTPPSLQTTYQVVAPAACGALGAQGADFDGTVLASDDRFPYFCTEAPPHAGRFRSTIFPVVSGAAVNGTWTFEARDVTGENTGTLVRWGIAAR